MGQKRTYPICFGGPRLGLLRKPEPHDSRRAASGQAWRFQTRGHGRDHATSAWKIRIVDHVASVAPLARAVEQCFCFVLFAWRLSSYKFAIGRARAAASMRAKQGPLSCGREPITTARPAKLMANGAPESLGAGAVVG